MSQHEAHIAALITLPWGLKVMPAFHWIYVSYTMINTLFRPPSGTTLPPPPFTRKDTTYNNFLAALEISKDIGRFNIALSGSWSNLNGMSQEQAGLALTYYPLGTSVSMEPQLRPGSSRVRTAVSCSARPWEGNSHPGYGVK